MGPIVFLIGISVAGAMGWYWYHYRPNWEVRVVVIDGKVVEQRGIADAQRHHLCRFLEEALPEGKTTVFAKRIGHRMRVDLQGQADPGTQQRIRNFLING